MGRSWVDPQDPVVASATSLAAELADPVRLTALQLLAAEGPHTMSQLADAIGVTAPRLGNHLARLRAAGLVTTEHAGRHAIYSLATPRLADVLAAVARYTHADNLRTVTERPTSATDIAHTCYDHLAGRLGVMLFATLVDRGAVNPPDGRGNELTLGSDDSAFTDLGVDVGAVDTRRRKLATACLDRTHRLPHLGGALGAALLKTFLDRGFVRATGSSRDLVVTPSGRRQLPTLLPGFTAQISATGVATTAPRETS